MKNLVTATIFITIIWCNLVSANTITVDTLDDTGSSSDGFCSLREAVLAASTDTAVDSCTTGELLLDVIEIDPAIVPTGGQPFQIDLQSRITITGGDLQISGLNSDLLEINGMQSVNIFRVDMSDGAKLTLQNLRLKDALATGAGGAIHIRPGVSVITLDGMELINNISNQEGGGISTGVNEDLDLFIIDSTISGNSAPRGGAISVTTVGNSASQLNLKISHSMITHNSATNGSGGALFALSFDTSSFIDIVVSDSLLTMNTADGTGGAISVAGQASVDRMSVALFRNLFYKNFSNNSSGGAYRSVNLDTTLVNNTFIENEAEFNGGAVSLGNTNGDRQIIIIANTFYQNVGGSGAPFVVAKELDIRFRDTPASTNIFQANLISTDLNNQSDVACSFNNTQALTVAGFNAVNDASCSVTTSDVVNNDLRLRLESGSTDIYPLTVRPLPNSVAIDLWDDSECQFESAPLTNDMTGLRRDDMTGLAFDGDADVNYDCDAGAFEAPPSNRLDVTITGSGSAYETSFDILCNSTCTMPVPSNEDLQLLALPGTNAVFSLWTGACGTALTGPCELNINTQTLVGVDFTNIASTSELLVEKNGDGLVTSDVMGIHCGLLCLGHFEHGSTVNLTATPEPGSIFTGWRGVCSGSGVCTVLIDDAVQQSARANFINQDYTLDVSITGTGSGTINSHPAGIDCNPDCSQSYPAGTQVELTAMVNGNDVFAGFSGDCTGTGSCILDITQDYSVTAEFQTLKTLDVSIIGSGQVVSTPAGIDCPGVCSLQANQFSTFTLDAITTVPGLAFIGWQGDCTPTGGGTSCVSSLIIDSDVTALFENDVIFADGFE